MTGSKEGALPARLRGFVEAFDALLALGPDEPRIVARGAELLRDLVGQDDWLPEEVAQPDAQYYRQYLLYRDARARYSIASFVWGPGQSTPIHDHTVWGLIGLLRGAEVEQSFRLDDGGRIVPDGAPRRLQQGMVGVVSPTLGDIHQVSNAYQDRVSISIHVYGADIGAVDRSVFTPDGARKPFRSAYANVPSLQ